METDRAPGFLQPIHSIDACAAVNNEDDSGGATPLRREDFKR